jgi:hypothetical protein
LAQGVSVLRQVVDYRLQTVPFVLALGLKTFVLDEDPFEVLADFLQLA